MMFCLGEDVPMAPVTTFVLRLWFAGGSREPRAFRYQTTHVQSGEIAYHGTLDGMMQHIQRLTEQLVRESMPQPPTPLFLHPRDGA
jgi:hypothetical protein